MPKITFIDANEKKYNVEAEVGQNIMEVAIKELIPGIVAECGGACSCATCHCYVDKEWFDKTGKPSGMEEDMLDFAVDVRDTSRLSCQIKVTAEMDGITIRIPERQH